MAKGRRRWTVRLVLLGALVWLLGWQGLGWLSGPGGGDSGGHQEAVREPAPHDERGRPADPQAAGSNRPPAVPPGETSVEQPREGSPGGGSRDGGGSEEEVSQPAAGAVAGAAAGAVAGGEDHVRALLRLTRQAVETGMLGGGFQALDELEGLPIAAVQREESRTVRAALEEHLREGVAELREDILGGRLLAARRRLGDLLRIPHTVVARALDGLARSQDWPALRSGHVPSGYVPEPRPLPADRFVRFYRKGVEVRARAVDCTTEEVTVHLRDERGVTYPSLRLTEVELPDATAAEAAEMGLAALLAGDVLLARLWVCMGLERGGSPRCHELAELLG